MIAQPSSGARDERSSLYIYGVPGKLGGASTKIAHLIKLLHHDYRVTIVAPEIAALQDKYIKNLALGYGVACVLRKELPQRLDGVALAICEPNVFRSGAASDLRTRGLRFVWSNEMMFPFKGEDEAVKQGLIDRVLFVSEFQKTAFSKMYAGVSSVITGNYIDPEDFPQRERRNPVFTIGRLSRDDPGKYPLDFPVFYEELGLRDARYRVMAWNRELDKQYRWHRFGAQWELLQPNSESALKFLHSLDLFLYPLGHRVQESWGRAVVEAMLTGCVPVVPSGHQFHRLIVNGESGFICDEYDQFRSIVLELYKNYPFRRKIAEEASRHAREHLCNQEEHRRTWVEALSFA
jgi:glycosyltransferase involved in cell wall biosynthesis